MMELVRTDGSERKKKSSIERTEDSQLRSRTTSSGTRSVDETLRGRGGKVRSLLRARLGEDVYSSWFNAIEFDSIEGGTMVVSVPVKFLRNWINSHYSDALLECCKAEFLEVKNVKVVLRQLVGVSQAGGVSSHKAQSASNLLTGGATLDSPRKANVLGRSSSSGVGAERKRAQRDFQARSDKFSSEDLAGSPLDSRYTFESFVVGASNRMAHAGALQVSERAPGTAPEFNPLYIHSAVGLGKTHLLHAVAWEMRRRFQGAQILYLTAERFRYQFVDALRSRDPFSFKNRFKTVDVLLVDDLEFMHGEKTEQEFGHIINTMLDGGRQVVVASARAPGYIERLDDRMRSRLQRGLVTQITSLDVQLRTEVLKKRTQEKQLHDSSFFLDEEVIGLLAERLTENGRELEGAVTRLFANWQYMRTPITLDIAETVIRDLLQGAEPRRIKIEDIMRIVSRHFGVSRNDLLSQRRHRSVVWPRQIGMYLAKQLTARSLPEIGKRFGNRDHTTVLHAIRKIEGQLGERPQLREELDELKKILTH